MNEMNYKVTIFTVNGVIIRKFYTERVATETIMEFKRLFEDFKLGTLSEKIGDKWHKKWTLSNNLKKYKK